MPTFPTSESEVVALVEAMIAGYTAHPADFPSIDPLTDLVALQTALTDYQTDKQSQADAKAQAQIATETKSEKLDAPQHIYYPNFEATSPANALSSSA